MMDHTYATGTLLSPVLTIGTLVVVGARANAVGVVLLLLALL